MISSSVFMVEDSSTLTTPSPPTFVIASPTISPTSSSRDETVATAAIAALSATGVADASNASRNHVGGPADSRAQCDGVMPAATLRRPF